MRKKKRKLKRLGSTFDAIKINGPNFKPTKRQGPFIVRFFIFKERVRRVIWQLVGRPIVWVVGEHAEEKGYYSTYLV